MQYYVKFLYKDSENDAIQLINETKSYTNKVVILYRISIFQQILKQIDPLLTKFRKQNITNIYNTITTELWCNLLENRFIFLIKIS